MTSLSRPTCPGLLLGPRIFSNLGVGHSNDNTNLDSNATVAGPSSSIGHLLPPYDLAPVYLGLSYSWYSNLFAAVSFVRTLEFTSATVPVYTWSSHSGQRGPAETDDEVDQFRPFEIGKPQARSTQN